MVDDCRSNEATSGDAAALAPFFAAARATAPEPPLDLLSAILADAAEAGAPHPIPARGPATARPDRPRRRSLAATLGGWRGATALAACAALGFWLGIAGSVTVDGGMLRSDAASYASASAYGADPVETFLDLASLE